MLTTMQTRLNLLIITGTAPAAPKPFAGRGLSRVPAVTM